MKNLFLVICLVLFCGSCQTIHYTNKSDVPQDYTYSKWHHIGILGLLEFSDPVNIQSICNDKNWKAVRTQKGFLQGLIPVASNVILSAVGIPAIGSYIYTPEEVAVACSAPLNTPPEPK